MNSISLPTAFAYSAPFARRQQESVMFFTGDDSDHYQSVQQQKLSKPNLLVRFYQWLTRSWKNLWQWLKGNKTDQRSAGKSEKVIKAQRGNSLIHTRMAVHELGHAIIHYIIGNEMKRMTILHDRAGDVDVYGVTVTDGANEIFRQTRLADPKLYCKKVLQIVLMLAAGQVSEHYYCVSTLDEMRQSKKTDVDSMREVLSRIFQEPYSTLTKVNVRNIDQILADASDTVQCMLELVPVGVYQEMTNVLASKKTLLQSDIPLFFNSHLGRQVDLAKMQQIMDAFVNRWMK